MRTRTIYSKAFKVEAVRLLEEGKKPVTDIARELGLRRNQLYKWKEQLDKKGESIAFPGHGRSPSVNKQAARIAELEKELASAKEDTAILKKAAAFFARELK